jgi:hypothetical protein
MPEDPLEAGVRDHEVNRSHDEPLDSEADRVNGVRCQTERMGLRVVVRIVCTDGHGCREEPDRQAEDQEKTFHATPPATLEAGGRLKGQASSPPAEAQETPPWLY